MTSDLVSDRLPEHTLVRNPDPTEQYSRIKCGYVGYISRGRFELLFDATTPLAYSRPGRNVPEGYRPLDPEACVDISYHERDSLRLEYGLKSVVGGTADGGTHAAR